MLYGLYTEGRSRICDKCAEYTSVFFICPYCDECICDFCDHHCKVEEEN